MSVMYAVISYEPNEDGLVDFREPGSVEIKAITASYVHARSIAYRQSQNASALRHTIIHCGPLMDHTLHQETMPTLRGATRVSLNRRLNRNI